MTGTQALRHHDNFLQVAKSYYQLTKPRMSGFPSLTLSYPPRWHSRRRRRSNLKLHL